MMKRVILILLFVTGFVSLPAQTVDDVINGYVQYIGGAARWKGVSTIVMEGTYDYGGVVFPFTSYSKAPNLYRYVVPYQGKYFEQAYDGQQGWKIDAFKNETAKTMLTGKAATLMMNEADVELESPFVDYARKGHRVVLEGEDSANHVRCYKVKLTRSNGDVETYFFDKSDYSLIQKVAVAKNAELGNAELQTVYGDYHTVKGVKIPYRSVSTLQGQGVLTVAIKKVKLNGVVDDKKFKP